MRTIIDAHALWLIVAWPLLLSIPALHSRLPWPRHLAIIPAFMLTLFSGDASLALPWILPGTGLAIDSESRWLLAMAVIIWLMAAMMARSSRSGSDNVLLSSFFMLTLAGNLGAILAADLVVFFCFSTLMGYGFYALLITGYPAKKTATEARRAGYLYLIYMIIADLALFETLLLAAYATESLRFEVIRQTLMGSSSSPLYIWLAFIAFTLKIGVWPVHQWLLAAHRSAHQSTIILLCGVPVAMGMLGAVRWLAPGLHRFYTLGLVMQIVGIAAILYALLRLVIHLRAKLLPAWVCVATTGLFITALGTGLAYPSVWQRYAYLTYPFIAAAGLFMAVLTFAIERLQSTRQCPAVTLLQVQPFYLWSGHWFNVVCRWVMHRLFDLRSFRHTLWLHVIKCYQSIPDWKTMRFFLTGWNSGITLLVLLGLALAWLNKCS